MKTINMTFDEKDFEKLRKAKDRSGAKSWEKFILEILKKEQRI